MLEHHVITGTGHLLVAIVIGIVTRERHRVTLVHPHMSESLKRVAGLIEIGTVAIKACALMGEVHLTIENRGIWILILVEMEHVGMYEIHTGILYLSLPTDRTFLLLLCKSRGHPHHQDNRQ